MSKDKHPDPQAAMKGTLISATANSVTMSHDDGSADHTHSVLATATVTLNGKAAKMADLQAGDHVELSGKPASSVTATRDSAPAK